MLTFIQMLALLEAGKRVGSPSLLEGGDYLAMDGDEVAVFDDDGNVVDSVGLNKEYMGATDFYEITAEENPEIWGYYNAEKGRWMSTNNAEGLRAKGIEVKLFVLAEG